MILNCLFQEIKHQIKETGGDRGAGADLGGEAALQEARRASRDADGRLSSILTSLPARCVIVSCLDQRFKAGDGGNLLLLLLKTPAGPKRRQQQQQVIGGSGGG